MTEDGCDNCGLVADLFYDEATGLAFCETCDATDGEEGVMLDGADNVRVHEDAGKLVVTIDLAVDLGESKSGKSRNVATTHGAVEVPGQDGLVLNLNAYRPVAVAA